MTRSIIRYNDWGITVLCPRGHVLTSFNNRTDGPFAGSQFQANVMEHQTRQGGYFDRLAAACNGHGH